MKKAIIEATTYYMIVDKGPRHNMYYCGLSGWSANSDNAVYCHLTEALAQIKGLANDSLSLEKVATSEIY